MRYLLAIIFPPAAVLLCGKPGQFVLNLILTLCIYFPGMIHAVLVVSDYYADKRTDRIVSAVKSSSGIMEEKQVKKNGKKNVPWAWIVLGGVLFMAVLSLFNKDDIVTPRPVKTTPVKTTSVKNTPSTQVKKTTNTSTVMETEEQKKVREMKSEMAVNTIKGYDVVRDAAVSFNKDTFSLVIIVGHGTNKDRAKKLGDDFVRLVKGMCDDPPGQSIGRGKYNYLIAVYNPAKTEIVSGAKAAASSKITW